MKPTSKDKILELCERPSGVRPKELLYELGISNAAIHRHLRSLEELNLIEKRGSAPRVIYVATPQSNYGEDVEFAENVAKAIEQNFCYFLPNGRELSGVEAFLTFLRNTGQDQKPAERAKEYLQILETAEGFRKKSGLIKGKAKLSKTFSDLAPREIYYSDFYSLPKYGKSKLGQYLLHGKSGQSKALISAAAEQTARQVDKILHKHNVDAVCYVPHSIPRKVSFLKEYKKHLGLALPEIELFKAYSGDVPIAQKSLSRLSERIANARETIFVENRNIPYKNILLIDDALGSGATMNEVAKKILAEIHPSTAKSAKIIGYAIVGSYKGFEVVREA